MSMVSRCSCVGEKERGGEGEGEELILQIPVSRHGWNWNNGAFFAKTFWDGEGLEGYTVSSKSGNTIN